MRKPSLLLTKLILFGILFLIAAVAPAKAQNNHQTVADTDTLRFGVYSIPGHIFNAIDPHYLVDRNGFATSVFDGATQKSFAINAFHDPLSRLNLMCEGCSTCQNCVGDLWSWSWNPLSLGTNMWWNYFINDHRLVFESRALVSTLMPRAMERVTFSLPLAGTANFVPNHGLRRPQDRERGIVRFYTRPIPPTNSDGNTLFLLNDVAITPRIFEAIRPIYIKSLERITDSDVLSSFNQVGLQEVVKIETFSHRELGLTVLSNAAISLLWVDGIELPITTDRKLKSDFFKERRSYFYADDNTPEYLRQRFPDKMYFTIITL